MIAICLHLETHVTMAMCAVMETRHIPCRGCIDSSPVVLTDIFFSDHGNVVGCEDHYSQEGTEDFKDYSLKVKATMNHTVHRS